MPWCEECSKYFAPSAMRPDGTCPVCHRPIDAPQRPPTTAAPDRPDVEAEVEAERAPWHFKLMVVALVVYLIWRFAEIFV